MCDCHMWEEVSHLWDTKILAQKKDVFVRNSLTHWLVFQVFDLSVIWNTFSEEDNAFFK